MKEVRTMKDKTSFSSSQQQISSDLQNYINSLVKEVVLNNKDFETQKKYITRYAEAEGLESEIIITNLNFFFIYFEEYKKTASDELKENINQHAKIAYIEPVVINKLLEQFSKHYALILTKAGTNKLNIARLLSKELGISVKNAALVVDALRKNKEVIISSGKPHDFYERLVAELSLVGTKSNILSSSKAFKSNSKQITLNDLLKTMPLETINEQIEQKTQKYKANLNIKKTEEAKQKKKSENNQSQPQKKNGKRKGKKGGEIALQILQTFCIVAGICILLGALGLLMKLVNIIFINNPMDEIETYGYLPLILLISGVIVVNIIGYLDDKIENN